MSDTPTRRGTGWVVFSGIVLVIAGLLNISDGLWALDHADTKLDTLFFENSLEGWGWFYVILGTVVVITGCFVFTRSEWARWTGVVIASIAVILNMFWIFEYPGPALVLTLMNSLVVYGLTVHGGRDELDMDTYWQEASTPARSTG